MCEMWDLQYRQQKIQERRKYTPRREFVKEVCCRRPIMLYNNQWSISRYPEKRIKNIASDASEHIVTGSYSGDFFQSFSELFHTQPLLPTTSFYGNENCEYSDGSFGGKNIYLSFDAGGGSENVVYSHLVYDNSHNIYQSLLVGSSSNIFDSSHIYNSHNIFGSHAIRDSSSIASSYNLVWCSHCIGCDNLEHVSYAIENEQVSPEVFMKKRHAIGSKSISSGDDPLNINDNFLCINSENIKHCDHLDMCRNIVFGVWGDLSSHIYDSINVWLNSEYMYAVSATWAGSMHLYCVAEVGTSMHCFYCYHLEACSYCVGCIGLKNKSYHILNKQYSKEKRHEKVNEIFSVMEKEGTLWDFFPWWMNPFYFNDTAAYLIDDSFTKEAVEAEGYLWRDEEVKVDIPEGVEIVRVEDLWSYEWRMMDGKFITLVSSQQSSVDRNELETGDWGQMTGAQRYIDPEILNKVIQDEEGNVYRIVQMEYDFLMKHGLPLPRLHRLDRLKMNFKIS